MGGSSHPIEPDAEDTFDVFRALLATRGEPGPICQAWEDRYDRARGARRRRRDYDREWDRNSASIVWGGQ